MKKSNNNSNNNSNYTRKILIYLFLVIFWVFLIYFFSDMNSYQSNKLSKGIVNNIVDKVENVKEDSLDEVVRYKKIRTVNFYIRKTAHVLEFLMLDLLLLRLLTLIFKDKDKHKLIYYSSIITFLCTLLDEFHQSFTGRTSQFSDCLIDSIGIVIVIIIFEIKELVNNGNKKEIKK